MINNLGYNYFEFITTSCPALIVTVYTAESNVLFIPIKKEVLAAFGICFCVLVEFNNSIV